MAKTTTLKRRISSVKNMRQITKAMELVAASKLRRAQDNAFRSRDFVNLSRQILTRLRETTDVNKHPLFHQRNVKTRLHVVMSSDRGLAGAYNSNIVKEFMRQVKEDQVAGITTQVIVVGIRGAQLLAAIEGIEILAVYNRFPENPKANDILPILNTIIDLYINKAVDAVDLIYTDYKTSISQVTKAERLLPAAFQPIDIPPALEEATFEPSPEQVLDEVTVHLIESLLTQAFYEAQASEQSMRLMAMKNATDNASDLIEDLTLVFNTVRQAAITQEIAEITGGAEAIQQ